MSVWIWPSLKGESSSTGARYCARPPVQLQRPGHALSNAQAAAADAEPRLSRAYTLTIMALNSSKVVGHLKPSSSPAVTGASDSGAAMMQLREEALFRMCSQASSTVTKWLENTF